MNLFEYFKLKIFAETKKIFEEKNIEFNIYLDNFTVEPPREDHFGDFSTNICLVYAKTLSLTPLDFALLLKIKLSFLNEIENVSIKKPGFLNFNIKKDFLFDQIKLILKEKSNYGAKNNNNKNINVEFVSANPTGPLHVGHVRGAVIGDVLSKILMKVGYKVTKEYYVNDAGNQIEILAKSVFLRYKEILTKSKIIIPEGLYPGEYLIPIAKKIIKKYGSKLLELKENDYLPKIKKLSIQEILNSIKNDLALLQVQIDVYTSEKKIIEDKLVEKTIKLLVEKNLVYEGVPPPPKSLDNKDWEPKTQTLFKSSMFGDDEDRTISKSDGSLTYFISDIAYHWDKLNRTNGKLINIWGADHAGYVKRMLAAVKALSGNQNNLTIKQCQLVNLIRDSKKIKMSKRKGTYITLQDIVKEVGSDAVRFIMLTRKNDQTLDFDFDKVMQKNKDNPVFYVQYAYARLCSILRKAQEYKVQSSKISCANLNLINHELQAKLCKKLILWPRVLENAAKFKEPHRIAFYLIEVASSFHTLWASGKNDNELRFFQEEVNEKTFAQLALVQATKEIINSGLEVLSVNAPEKM